MFNGSLNFTAICDFSLKLILQFFLKIGIGIPGAKTI